VASHPRRYEPSSALLWPPATSHSTLRSTYLSTEEQCSNNVWFMFRKYQNGILPTLPWFEYLPFSSVSLDKYQYDTPQSLHSVLFWLTVWAGIATCYGLDGLGIESRWGRDFLHPSRPALGPTQPPIQWVPGLFPGGKKVSFLGVKRPGRGVDHPPSSTAGIKERVELYLYSPSGPSWPVLGRTLPFFWLIVYMHSTIWHFTVCILQGWYNIIK
jgi:hypothetical protein